MSAADITEMLDLLNFAETAKAELLQKHPARAEYDRLMAQIADVNAQLTAATLPLDAEMADLRNKIVDAVLARKETVAGASLQAVWIKPRETVNMDMFRGYMTAHPEVRKMVRTGEPSVSIRPVKQ